METPWKTQLTTLQSQDTALSSIGTLLSNLSNDMSSLTDFTGVLAQKTGASSNTNVLELTAASTSAVAGTHTVVVNNLAQTASGYLDAITNASDTLAGSISLQIGSGTAENIVIGAAPASPAANTIYTGSGVNSLSALASAINSSGIGVTASVLTDAAGSRLSLVSGTSGSAGQMTITSSLTDASMTSTSNPTGALNYNATVQGKNASLSVDGVPLSSATNIVTNLIPGVTFQMLSPSATDSSGNPIGVQVVIGNDNTSVESTINSMVTDYNSLISAMQTQEGNDSSGNPEPLFGSPTLSLLQQQLLGGINLQNPSGYLDSISSSTDTLSGSIQIAVGNGTAHEFDLSTLTDKTLAGLAGAINSASIGVTANVVTDASGSRSSLSRDPGICRDA